MSRATCAIDVSRRVTSADLDHYDVSPWARALLLKEAERRIDDGRRK
jgi:hypothetical protein